MPKTVQIRNLDDETYRVLAGRAARDGISVPELLRKEAERMASRSDLHDWMLRTDRIPPSGLTTESNLAALDAIRGISDDDRR